MQEHACGEFLGGAGENGKLFDCCGVIGDTLAWRARQVPRGSSCRAGIPSASLHPVAASVSDVGLSSDKQLSAASPPWGRSLEELVPLAQSPPGDIELEL